MRAHVCRSHLVLLLTFYAYEKCADYTDRCAGAISKSRGSAAGSRVVGSFHRRDWKSCTLKSVNIPTLSLQNTTRAGHPQLLQFCLNGGIGIGMLYVFAPTPTPPSQVFGGVVQMVRVP